MMKCFPPKKEKESLTTKDIKLNLMYTLFWSDANVEIDLNQYPNISLPISHNIEFSE